MYKVKRVVYVSAWRIKLDRFHCFKAPEEVGGEINGFSWEIIAVAELEIVCKLATVTCFYFIF